MGYLVPVGKHRDYESGPAFSKRCSKKIICEHQLYDTWDLNQDLAIALHIVSLSLHLQNTCNSR